jgi:hypothetical protein
VIAQEVEEVFPELVETTPEGLKKVNYDGLFAPLIEVVKELDARLQVVEERLELRAERDRPPEQIVDLGDERPGPKRGKDLSRLP